MLLFSSLFKTHFLSEQPHGQAAHEKKKKKA
jgi:hypothetical protein